MSFRLAKRKLKHGFDFATRDHFELIARMIESQSWWDTVVWATYRIHRIKLAQHIAEVMATRARRFKVIVGTDKEVTSVDRIVIGALPNSTPKNTTIRVLRESHAKFVVAKNKRTCRAVLTTKNMGYDSGWYEFSCVLDPDMSAEVYEYARTLWSVAQPVKEVMAVTNHSREIEDLFKERGI